MITPAYTVMGPDLTVDVLGAVRDFVKTYAYPAITEANIYQDVAPSGDSNEFCVVSALAAQRRGTTLERFVNTGAEDEAPEKIEYRTLYDCQVQVDCYSDDDSAWRRAHTLETLARSSAGAAFFADYGIGCHYADDIKKMTSANASGGALHCYTLTLHLSYWGGVDVGTAWFTDITLKQVEDADMYHPPRTGEE
jgi:hypothetical protein